MPRYGVTCSFIIASAYNLLLSVGISGCVMRWMNGSEYAGYFFRLLRLFGSIFTIFQYPYFLTISTNIWFTHNWTNKLGLRLLNRTISIAYGIVRDFHIIHRKSMWGCGVWTLHGPRGHKLNGILALLVSRPALYLTKKPWQRILLLIELSGLVVLNPSILLFISSLKALYGATTFTSFVDPTFSISAKGSWT